jgi:hypothetical protein
VRGEFTFGPLFYDSSDVRLSTARSSSNLDVGSGGYHTNLGFTDPPQPNDPLQKCFKVLNLAVTGHWNCAGNETATPQDRCWKFSAVCNQRKGGVCGLMLGEPGDGMIPCCT